jgi:DNA-binding transcriptional LysR family regulator
MELRPLRYFCAVAERGSFSQAARALHVSQSAVSEQVAGLEGEIGVQLIDRSRRAIRLTAHGVLFLPEAKKVLAAAEYAVEVARRSERSEIGVLRVGFFAGGIGAHFPNVIRAFRQRYPQVRVVLAEMNATEQWQALLDGEIDVGFTRSFTRDTPQGQKLESEVVHRDEVFAVLPRTHAAVPGPVDLRALAHEPFVMCERETSPALYDKVMELCAEAGFAPRIANTSAVWRSIVMLVQAGEGIALLPLNLQQQRASDLAFCPLKTKDAYVELVMAWSPARETAMLQSFRKMVHGTKQRI